MEKFFTTAVVLILVLAVLAGCQTYQPPGADLWRMI